MKHLAWLFLSAGFLLGETKISFEKDVEPLLEDFCHDCHADGSSKGDFSMEDFDDLSAHLSDVSHWLPVWRNIRSQIMPPSEKDQFTAEEKKTVLRWIEQEVFKVDPNNPDPGRVTIRRLNRQEYHYAIDDLLGVRYDTWENFPADDTGYGFDTIGSVLTISPLLMEKYLDAAADIVEKALPKNATSSVPRREFDGNLFRAGKDEVKRADWSAFAKPRSVHLIAEAPAKGPYEITLNYAVRGAEAATDQTAQIELWVGDRKIAEQTAGWDQAETIELNGKAQMADGDNRIEVRFIPRDPAGADQEEQFFQLQKVTLNGPVDGSLKEYPKGYRMIMVDGPAPKDIRERELYARKIMRSFVSRAYRRPLDGVTVGKLVKIVLEVDRQPGRTFEDGIKHAMTAVLASPRFLFRAEIQPDPNDPGKIVDLDEYALASRLSFFLWSSVPDDELLSLAYKKTLRKELRAQVKRMLEDPKAERFTENFVGQWLQTRDVEHAPIDSWRIIGTRDRRKANSIFNYQVRQDMRKETEMFFKFILMNNRPAEELISARYSFLNERLANFYKVNGVKGSEHRLVDLTENPERGGILTQGSFLIVSSNPTRTSPVKRGLFVLDQILGTPAPPAPPNVPELEEIAHKSDKPLSMREMMEIHRQKPICAGCHARMDPIGLGLENFNAIGQFRREENGIPVDSAGQLVTGETFSDVASLKTILADKRRDDFYRCISEKLMTYAIGRGMEYYDSPTIDSLVKTLHENNGSLKELVIAVTGSAPFQKRRGAE
ncbi:MAG: DUF1592 domain-containing protein [Verrucomicrobiaceae bacterium]